MRKILSLSVFLFFFISYSQEIDKDSISINNYQIIDYKEELKKFKDSIDNKIYPIAISKIYSKLNSDLIIENTDNMDKLYKLSKTNISNKKRNNYKVETNGNISRGVTVGSNQNSVLNSELDLQISGELSKNIKIKASIQDSDIPLQNNGYSQQIDEFDQIFIELSSNNWTIRGGDIDISESKTFFGNFEKKIQGLSINANLKDSINIQAAGAIVKGKYKRSQVSTENGNQGPYKIIGSNGELYVLIVSGSESVFVNGKKIQRGIDKDYVINYNAAEIIFNSTFPIMSDMRVQIEYQVNENNYNGFVGYTKLNINRNKFTHNISFYNENDIKDQPLLQNISENQIEILSSAGDNNELMSAPTGVLAAYEENRILYKKSMVNNSEIYIYSNNPNDELYDVNFTNVGENQGDYILLINNTIENIYEYVSPINGEKQGSFDPVIQLIAPEKLQLFTYNSIYKTNSNSKINIELTASKKDKNLFSSIDDNDNSGLASKINYKSENEINNSKLSSEIDIKYVQNNFQSIQRVYNTEFNRDWDLNESVLKNYNYLFSNGIFDLQNDKLGSIKYTFEDLRLDNYYKGVKNSLNFVSNNVNNLRVNSYTSIMKSQQDSYSSEFAVSNNKVEFIHKIGWVEANYNYEKKISSGIQNLISPDFGHKLYELKKGFGDKEKTFLEIGYAKKVNDSIFNGTLNKVNSYERYFLNSRILSRRNSKINIYVNQNKLSSISENKKEDFLNTKLLYNQKLFRNNIDSNLFYETNSGNLPQQEYTFIEVEPGLGMYKWIDINNNNIQELEEFEIAVFEDEGNYIRVLLPNQIFIKTYQSKFNYSIKLSLINWVKSENQIKRFLSRLSNQFQYSLDKKTNLNINPEIELNPFSLNESGLLAFNYSLKNVFYLNKSKQKYSLIYTYLKNKSKNNFSFGSTRNSNTLNKVNFIHKIDDLYLLEIISNRQEKSNWSENFTDKNFRLNEYNINPKITYFSGDNNRLNFIYKYSSIDNSIGEGEKLKQQNFGISLFLNEKDKRGFISEFNYYKNDFTGNQNTVISYVMMNGLQNGENYTWSFKFQRKLSKLLDFNFIYMGRKGENSKTIHNGTMQIKAVF